MKYLLIEYDKKNKTQRFYIKENLDLSLNKSDSLFCFYDWLRKNTDDIVGIRVCPFVDYEFQYELIQNYLNTFIIKEYNVFEIYFDLNFLYYNTDLSNDQSFMESIIIFSDNIFSLAFSLEDLEEREKKELVNKINYLY